MKFYTPKDRKQFYDSKEWKEIKEKLFTKRGKVCEKCSSIKNIQVHHLSYKRFGGDELDQDLLIVCKKCHMDIHNIDSYMTDFTTNKQAKFVVMPIEIFLNPNINGRSKNLFSFLYMYKNSDYGCYASNHYLARMCIMPERRVTECLNILEKWKYIRIENRKSGERRRIFISNFEEIYSKVSKLCFDMRKDPSDVDIDCYKNLFFNAREGKNE